MDPKVQEVLRAWRESDEHLTRCPECRRDGCCPDWESLYWHAVALREIILGVPVVNLRARRPLSLV